MTIAVSAKELHNLISAAKRSDPDAWALLVRRGYRPMLAYARRRLPGESAVAAVEQTFERACERMGDLRDTTSFDSWMFALLRSVIVEIQRSKRPGKASPGRPEEPAAQGNGDLAGMRRAFSRLGAAEQDLLELRVLGGLAAEEVASMLGGSQQSIARSEASAIQRLKNLLADGGLE